MNRALKVALLSSVGALALAPMAQAADHIDSPAAVMNPAADITDVYAFTDQGDATKVNLIMNVVGPAFSDAVQYVFHLEQKPSVFGAAATPLLIICQFDAAGEAECWAGDDEYVTGDASATAGISSASGALKVFAGQRNDPFFFNFTGFAETLSIVKGAAPNLAFDGAGCPQLDAATSNLLVTQLPTEPGGAAAADDFAAGTVNSLVIQIDRSVFGTQPVLAVWASTNTR